MQLALLMLAAGRLAGGLLWVGFLTFGVVSEQVKTRLEAGAEKQSEQVLPSPSGRALIDLLSKVSRLFSCNNVSLRFSCKWQVVGGKEIRTEHGMYRDLTIGKALTAFGFSLSFESAGALLEWSPDCAAGGGRTAPERGLLILLDYRCSDAACTSRFPLHRDNMTCSIRSCMCQGGRGRPGLGGHQGQGKTNPLHIWLSTAAKRPVLGG